MAVAYCWRSGQIKIGRKVPDGAIAVLRGPAKFVRDTMCVCARHGYRKGVLLVPGIPEADTDDEAEAALEAFIAWVKRHQPAEVA